LEADYWEAEVKPQGEGSREGGCSEADYLGEEGRGPEAGEENLQERRSWKFLRKARLHDRAECVLVGVKHDNCAMLLQILNSYQGF
jgi:hypothetical protein